MKDSILNSTLIVVTFVGILVIAFQGGEGTVEPTMAARASPISAQKLEVAQQQMETAPVLAAVSR